MAKFHAIMLDECGDEYSLTITARSYDAARAAIAEDYPESRLRHLETAAQSNRRERDRQRRIERSYDSGYDYSDYGDTYY